MEGTNGIPHELEHALVEAKQWYDEKAALEETIAQADGLAERNAEDRDEMDRKAAPLLENVVEAVMKTWGYA